MGKTSKSQKLNAASDMVKNLDPKPETRINGSGHHVLDPVVSKKLSNSMHVRRSGRLQSVIKTVENQQVERINLVESEKEDELLAEDNVEQLLNTDNLSSGPTSNQKTLDEKVGNLMRAVAGFKTKGAQGLVPCENTSVSLYKSLYHDSQKKIEALTLENHELTRKLEIAIGKLEVYENLNKYTHSDMISNLEKAVEALVRPMSHVDQFSSPADDTEADGGGVVAKELPAKKRRQDKTSK